MAGALLTGASRVGEFGAGLDLDLVGQARDYVIEDVDLRLGIIIGADHEQVSHPP